MKAVRFEKKGVMNLIHIPIPEVTENSVLVKVVYCGICGSDMSGFLREEERIPGTVLGHETVGIVEKIGEKVQGLKVGDRVAVGPSGSCPEQCYFCSTGRPHLCIHGFERTLGIGGGTQGGFAEYILAEYPSHQLVPVPDKLSMEEAVLFDIFATAGHARKRSHMKPGDFTVVIGAGAIGLSLLQILKAAGAGIILAIEPDISKRERAMAFGADAVFSPEDREAIEAYIREYGNGHGPDSVFECVGRPGTVHMAVELAERGSEVILVGASDGPLSSLSEDMIVFKELDLKGSFCYDEADIREVLEMMNSGRLKTEGMVSKIVAIDDTQKAMEELANTSMPVRYVIDPWK